MLKFLAHCMLAAVVSFLPVEQIGRGNILTPPSAPVRLEPDGQTIALYELTSESIRSGRIEDLAGKSSAARLTGPWKLITLPELQPAYQAAAKAQNTGDKANPTRITFADLPVNGAFSIDILWRTLPGGGLGIQLGADDTPASPPLQLNLLHRGPGSLQLRIPVKSADGRVKTETFATSEVYHAPRIGPLRYDDFHTTSLVFDGGKTLTFFVNGHKAVEYVVRGGDVAASASPLVIGDVGSSGGQFAGSVIAAVRVSQGVRPYAAQAAAAAAFSPSGGNGWIFDAGPAQSPVSAEAIGLSAKNLYSAERGFGWLKTPLAEYDSWYSPGRFDYAPAQALAKNTHKLHDAMMRDGVVLPDGDFFRADIPDGAYWVTVGLGDSHGSATVKTISANGVEIGSDLRMKGNIYKGNIPHRVARGLVRVEKGRGLLLAGQSGGGEGLPIQSIAVLPYVPAPVIWQGAQLRWQGTGSAPAALTEISRLLAIDDFAGAAKTANAVSDPLAKAGLLACVLGKPHLPAESDLAIAWQIRQALITVLRQDPANAAARWMYDSTERMRHALIGYTNERGTEVVYGAKAALLFQVANQGLALCPEDPEYWQARFIAAAAIWQNGVQSSAFGATSDSYVTKTAPEAFGAPGSLFRQVTAAWPQFRISRIMLGEKLPTPGTWKSPGNAPQWAALQYELLTRVIDTIHYWVNQRMDANGLLGGGLGDDVEALRWWGPGITLADDKTTIDGFVRLSEAAWRSTRGKGFSLMLQDVEHSAEDISDSQPMRALIGFGAPEYRQTVNRLLIMKPVFRDIWTGIDTQNHRMFKGHFLSATAVDREGDVPYNLRAIRPLLWGAWANQGKDKELDELLVAYARSWRDATMAEFDGKPRGIVPMMIRWGHQKARKEQADGHMNAPTSWVFPGYWSYEFPGGYAEHVYDLLLAAYELSGDMSFLEPIQFGLRALAKVPDNDMVADKYVKGSFDWALRAAANMIGIAGGNYRVLTGDHSFDDVLLRIAPPHSRFMILAARAKDAGEQSAALAPVIQKLQADLHEMNCNAELRTTMVQSTDRIYVRGSLILDAMATGVTTSPKDLRGGEMVWPTYQITWAGTHGKLAALVEKASPAELQLQLYSFADHPLNLRPRVWRLDPGTYQLLLTETDAAGQTAKKELFRQTIEIQSHGQQLEFELPAQVPAVLSVLKK